MAARYEAEGLDDPPSRPALGPARAGPHRPGAEPSPVADITQLATSSGFAHVAFVLDLFSRRIVGWRVSTSRADLALDALEHALWQRQRGPHEVSGVVHRSDREVQYLSIRCTNASRPTGGGRDPFPGWGLTA